MRRRILSLLLILVLLSTLAPFAGAQEVLELNKRGSISITMTYQKKPVAGGKLTLYRVADVVDDNGSYSFAYTSSFSGCSIPVTELSSAKLPEKLAAIAKDKKVQGTTRTVDRKGKVKFSYLKVGLYLVVQDTAASGYKKINPFLVSVPYNDDGRYVYDVDTAPKNLPGPETQPTTKPTKPGSKLPQTGQNNWPVPVMAAAGMLTLCGGLCLIASGKKKNDEA